MVPGSPSYCPEPCSASHCRNTGKGWRGRSKAQEVPVGLLPDHWASGGDIPGVGGRVWWGSRGTLEMWSVVLETTLETCWCNVLIFRDQKPCGFLPLSLFFFFLQAWKCDFLLFFMHQETSSWVGHSIFRYADFMSEYGPFNVKGIFHLAVLLSVCWLCVCWTVSHTTSS